MELTKEQQELVDKVNKDEQLLASLHKQSMSSVMENERLMKGIAHEMKEIPELPSEKPTDVKPLTKVEFPHEGGILTYMEGHEFPYRGFPFFEFVEKIDIIKKISRGLLSGIYAATQGKFRRFLVPFYLKDIIYSEIYTFHRHIDRFKIKYYRYSKIVREVYNAYSFPVHNETERGKEIRLMMRDLFCMYLENDNAYRYRFQDIFVEINKTNMRKNPIKELHRLYDIMMQREVTQEIKDTWVLTKMLLDLFLRYDKDVKKLISEVSLRLDPDKIALDELDIYWCKPRKDYNFGFSLCQSYIAPKIIPQSINSEAVPAPQPQ